MFALFRAAGVGLLRRRGAAFLLKSWAFYSLVPPRRTRRRSFAPNIVRSSCLDTGSSKAKSPLPRRCGVAPSSRQTIGRAWDGIGLKALCCGRHSGDIKSNISNIAKAMKPAAASKIALSLRAA